MAGFRLPDYGGGTTTIGATSSTRLPALKEPVSSGATEGGGGTSSTSNTGNTGKMRKASGFGG